MGKSARTSSKSGIKIVADYTVAADAKNRISLRGARSKYFRVQGLSNGCFVLKPRLVVPPQALSARSMKMLDKSAANLKRGLASDPVNLDGVLPD